MKIIKRFILVKDNGATYQELDQTNYPSEATRLAKHYESCQIGNVLILCSADDMKLIKH